MRMGRNLCDIQGMLNSHYKYDDAIRMWIHKVLTLALALTLAHALTLASTLTPQPRCISSTSSFRTGVHPAPPYVLRL